MNSTRHRALLAAAVGLAGLPVGLAAPGASPSPAPVEIVVYAAASLRDVLQELTPPCEKAIEARLVFNFGASNDLARQIDAASKADVFFSADEAWMDRVARAGLVDAASRRSLLSNRLVVVGASDSSLTIAAPSDLKSAGVRRLALASPEAVPAGKYAKAWLEKAGAWAPVADRVVPFPDVRAALAAVESGGADAGIVYRTDAAISKRVKVLYEVPAAEGPRISYAVAAIQGRPRVVAARRLVTWLAGPEALPVFERFGFVVPAQAPSSPR
jgi:molybdate transport system substrate-binding protein